MELYYNKCHNYCCPMKHDDRSSWLLTCCKTQYVWNYLMSSFTYSHIELALDSWRQIAKNYDTDSLLYNHVSLFYLLHFYLLHSTNYSCYNQIKRATNVRKVRPTVTSARHVASTCHQPPHYTYTNTDHAYPPPAAKRFNRLSITDPRLPVSVSASQL